LPEIQPAQLHKCSPQTVTGGLLEVEWKPLFSAHPEREPETVCGQFFASTMSPKLRVTHSFRPSGKLAPQRRAFSALSGGHSQTRMARLGSSWAVCLGEIGNHNSGLAECGSCGSDQAQIKLKSGASIERWVLNRPTD